MRIGLWLKRVKKISGKKYSKIYKEKIEWRIDKGQTSSL